MFSSTTKSVSLIQYFAISFSLIGLFFFDFTLENYLTLAIFYFLYSGIGISMMLHRYYTHKSFEFKIPLIKWIFTWFSITAGRGGIIGWVYVHRMHHLHSDTKEDPHYSSLTLKGSLFPSYDKFIEKVNLRIVRDSLTKENIFIDKYYTLLILLWITILGVIDLDLLYFGWILPVTITHIAYNTFLYIGHNLGYRSHHTKDNSKNSWIYAILLWGEGWHNNHHKNAGQWNLQEKWWEVDIIGQAIRFVKK